MRRAPRPVSDPGGRAPATGLDADPPPWGAWGAAALGLVIAAGLALRLWHLGAEGFADDEVHKWLAANRYLHGDFGGDDLEHPMLMKALIAFALRVSPQGLSPEAVTRLPNALSGAVLVWAVAHLGRRLFGRAAGLLAAALVALSATAVGYGRIAKEDVLLAPFTVLVALCVVEAHAAAEAGLDRRRRRYELAGAAALAAALASKYLLPVALVPIAIHAWLRAGTSPYRVPLRRWLGLAAVALAVFLVLDPVIVLPSTLHYIRRYVAGDPLGDRAKSESLMFLGRLYDNRAFHFRGGVPIDFYLAFAALKLAPPTVIMAAAGLGIALVRQARAHRVLLAWLGVFLVSYTVMSAKYGRYFLPILPAFALLAAHAAVEIGRRLPRKRTSTSALALLLAGAEAFATLPRMPHPRLYVNAFGGGDAAVDTAFPHCDYFDAGVREAIAEIARRAEPGAQIGSDTDWLARYYAERDARPDLTIDRLLPDRLCHREAPCYVVVPTGRHYWHNAFARGRLAPLEPWTVVHVGGHVAVRVYRVEPGARAGLLR